VKTIPLDLDGYTDLPPGKIANVVTFLEMISPPGNPRIARADLSVRRVAAPDLAWYRSLYRRVGERWLWFSRAVMADERLRARLAEEATEVHALEQSGEAIGFAELSRAVPGEVEIAMFGVVPKATGTGAARFLMEAVLDRAWGPDVRRVWLHTCTFDHPAAVPFYLARGFMPWKYAIEVSDDPRLSGFLPLEAAPHVPVIVPTKGGGQRA
jgi:N-acetylglutamate synthase-like GNAT family acetyltransferase